MSSATRSSLSASDPTMDHYLRATDVIDWQHPSILQHASTLAASVIPRIRSIKRGSHADDSQPLSAPQPHLKQEQRHAIAQACFEWVRDNVHHSFDYQLNPITCRASDVLKHRTGYCYAKSHLLSALLRANGIAAGFCYQRLSVDETGEPYCLHGLNGIYLPDIGWYRVDPRGNKPGINAQFSPPIEALAFDLNFSEEADFITVLSDPLPVVINCLEQYHTWEAVLANLPDVSLSSARQLGLHRAAPVR